MSAPAPRAPARPWTVARHYLGMLGSGGGAWAIGVGLLLVASGAGGTDGAGAMEGVRSSLPLAFFLPLLHWRESSRASALDAAMPLDRRWHDYVRVLCGAAWAGVAILVVVGVFMAASLVGGGPRFGGYPWWYPFPALTGGILLYLFGSAVWLLAERPGRALFLAFVLFYFLAGAVIPLVGGKAGMDTFDWATSAMGWTSEGGLRATPAGWALGSAMWLTIAWILVCICAEVDRWREGAHRGPSRRGLPAQRRRAAPAASPAARTGRPARAAPRLRPVPGAWVAFRRELLLVGHRMPWLLAFTVFFTWTWFETESIPSNTVAPMVLDPSAFNPLSALFLLPLLVWLDAHRPGRQLEDALPVNVAARRAMRILAGAAWLGLALVPLLAGALAGDLAGGKLDSLASVPARVWLGVPGATLLSYLLGSLPALLVSRRPVPWTFAWWFAFGLLGRLRELPVVADWHGWRYSPWAALHPLGQEPWAEQSWEPALALWLTLAVAATAAATVGGARLDREGGRSRTGHAPHPAAPAPA